LEYVSEEQLKEEIIALQKSARYRELLSMDKNSPDFPVDEYNQYVEEKVDPNYSKQKFGEMVLLIVTNLAKKGNFSGYTWKDDFYSNALEKILSYVINNFDANKISKRSGKQVKAFAYVTQIASNAFKEIINERKEEIKLMEEYLVPLDEFYDQYKLQFHRHVYEEEQKDTHEIEIYMGFPTEGGLQVFVGREKDYILEGNYTENVYYVIQDNAYIFSSVYDILCKYKDKKVKIILKDYSISLEEYEKIKQLNMEYLDICSYSNKYKPNFPKKASKEKEDFFKDWE
jgi:predicted nucleic acid-binding Zn finger protein